jgi:LAGLIDADG-like domain
LRDFECLICGKAFKSNRQLAGHRAGKHREHVGVKSATINVTYLTSAQKGYIAAFLDGEGGIQITRSYRKDREYKTALHPDVYFTNTNEEVIRTIRKWLGGGSITRRRERENHKDTYVLTISGVKSILQLLEAVRPHMIVKGRRADLMMEFCKSRISHNRGKGRRYTENELRLYRAIKKLNKRGGGAKKRQPTDR